MTRTLKSTNGKPVRRQRAGSRYFALERPDQIFLRRLGRTIASEMMHKKISAEELANEADLARSTVREIIAGRSDPRVLSLKSIAAALGFKNLTEFIEKSMKG